MQKMLNLCKSTVRSLKETLLENINRLLYNAPMDELITPADLGRRGGEKTYKLHGKEHYKEMQRLGVQNRKRKKELAKIGIE